MDLNLFKDACLNQSADIVVQQFLIEGYSYYFEENYNTTEEFQFKKDLATSLNIHIRDIAIVGSGKLGFSIKPEEVSPGLYLFKEFDFDYKSDNDNDKSDIDIAIISGKLFDSQLLALYKHTNSYKDLSGFKNKSYSPHSKSIVKGWLRPDKIPKDYNISDTIENLRKEYKDKYDRKINFGIYKSWDYFESYHINNIKTLKVNLQYNT
ncbi:MAG: hypothetical protein K8R39_03920 [Arcobacteraceae bacterium]|nr:hypothetical protein [Arcobacteraceae bacterium]